MGQVNRLESGEEKAKTEHISGMHTSICRNHLFILILFDIDLALFQYNETRFD